MDKKYGAIEGDWGCVYYQQIDEDDFGIVAGDSKNEPNFVNKTDKKLWQKYWEKNSGEKNIKGSLTHFWKYTFKDSNIEEILN